MRFDKYALRASHVLPIPTLLQRSITNFCLTWLWSRQTRLVGKMLQSEPGQGTCEGLGPPFTSSPRAGHSLSPNPPKDTDGRREESGRGGEGATGEIAWVPFGVGRSADGLHRRTGAPMAVCGSCDAGDGERIRSRELSRTGLARVCGDLRLSGGWVADGAVRPGVEWLAAGPRRG